ncbi:zinc-dependent peptidase [Lewinella sp. IMCC34191]|uniref:zinc-dependent peptidase n=1 Tax=Lewinella sp. IMCC34191 TaxID=2259172 RepID=UPI000E24E3C2|nr:zinc-dependent peptidase [Lewinella sp. IMCC34191]
MDPVRAIYLATLCLMLLGAILTWQTGDVQSELLLLPALAAAGAYTLAPQLRWWYWKKHPPDLSTELAPLLERFPLYRALDLDGKRDFRRRTFLIREATEFTGMAIETIPADVRLMVAASAATVTYYREEFLVPGFENVIFYPHQFPTPEHDVLHASEMYAKDGVIIWTLKYLIRSVVEPDKYLQLGIYEYTRALFSTDAEARRRAQTHTLTLEEIYRLTDFSPEALRKFIGLEDLDVTALTLTVFHTHAPRFAGLYPDKFQGILQAFPLRLPQSPATPA